MWRYREKKREGERDSTPQFSPQMAVIAGARSGCSQELGVLSEAATWVQGPMYVGHLPWLSQVHWQGDRSKMEQLNHCPSGMLAQ